MNFIQRLRSWFKRAPTCPYGCDDKIVVNCKGSLFRSSRSIMFRGRCPIHDKPRPI